MSEQRFSSRHLQLGSNLKSLNTIENTNVWYFYQTRFSHSQRAFPNLNFKKCYYVESPGNESLSSYSAAASSSYGKGLWLSLTRRTACVLVIATVTLKSSESQAQPRHPGLSLASIVRIFVACKLVQIFHTLLSMTREESKLAWIETSECGGSKL